MSATLHVCNISGISWISWSALIPTNHPPQVCTETDGQRFAERKRWVVCWQIDKKKKKKKSCHNAAAESWNPPPPLEIPQPIAAKPGWSLYPDAAEILCSTNIRPFFHVTPQPSQLTMKLVQSPRERVSEWASEYVTTEGVCCSFTNMCYHCSKVLQCYSSVPGLTYTEYTTLNVTGSVKCVTLQKLT